MGGLPSSGQTPRSASTSALSLSLSLFCPFLSVAAGVGAKALVHFEGAFEESPSVQRFYPLYTSPRLHPSVFSPPFGLYFSSETLCIPSSTFCFSHSYLPALVPERILLCDVILVFCRVTTLVRNSIFLFTILKLCFFKNANLFTRADDEQPLSLFCALCGSLHLCAAPSFLNVP